jgi:hypothetical protein
MADPDWKGGRYLLEGGNPRRGLAVARMGAHITYLSDAALHRKFGRKFQDRANPTFSFDADFEVESYLRHQGISFVERFDANSYLYLTRAMDYFDLAADHDGVLANASIARPLGFASSRSPATGCFQPRNRAPPCTRSMPVERGYRSRKSRPIAVTTRFCSTFPNFSTSCARSWNPQARRAV